MVQNMNCETFKKYIHLYLDDLLFENQLIEFKEHLQNCDSCKNELTAYEKLDIIARTEILPSPPGDYWDELPQIVIRRLGLVPKPSPIHLILTKLTDLWFTPQFRWGMVATLLVAGLIFATLPFLHKEPLNLTNIQFTESQKPVEKEKPVIPPVELNAKSQQKIQKTPKSKTPPVSIVKKFPDTTTKRRNVLTKNKMQKTPNFRSLLPKNLVGMLTPRLLSFTQNLTIDHELYPIPATDFLPLKDLVVNEHSDTRYRVLDRFALDVSGSRTPVTTMQLPEISSETPPVQGAYLEVLWIVQQSVSLEEKKNIWLSYISREQDPTYKSLGIYHLALVLSQEATETRDQEKARKALRFYFENEKALRFQMGEHRYEMKINNLKKVIAK
ncbi:MAG: zf-HC2 domain-containing protein [Calditrichaeota bacterium]|nr:MAG: zf-HC2 domain-containing protein [Calditrichota bacterium]